MRAHQFRSRRAALAMLMAGVAVPAASQDAGGVLDLTGVGIYAMEEAVMQAAQETTTRPRARQRPAPAPTARLSYTPSMARRRANLAMFVERSRRKDPKGAARLQQEIAKSDIIGRMNGELARVGLRADNVADAYAAWWLNAWLASRQRTDTPPRSQIAAVRAQAAQAMTSAGLATASDATKQEVAEANLVQAMLIGSYMEHAKSDRDLSRRLAVAVRQGARASGLNLDAMELTDEGFTPRRSGALQPVRSRDAGG
jgi:hypothetical protein